MNRKVCLHIDVIHSLTNAFLKRNTLMEEQFNHHPGAAKCKYIPGHPVLAKDYHNSEEKWIQRHITCHSENVRYNVDIQSSVWVWHANQLRPSSLPEIKSTPLYHWTFYWTPCNCFNKVPKKYQWTNLRLQQKTHQGNHINYEVSHTHCN